MFHGRNIFLNFTFFDFHFHEYLFEFSRSRSFDDDLRKFLSSRTFDTNVYNYFCIPAWGISQRLGTSGFENAAPQFQWSRVFLLLASFVVFTVVFQDTRSAREYAYLSIGDPGDRWSSKWTTLQPAACEVRCSLDASPEWPPFSPAHVSVCVINSISV